MRNVEILEISFANFLSVGKTPVTINLAKSNATLITGRNGSGKTTLADALTFVLFGKSYRDVVKPKLVNIINKTKCEVSCKLISDGDEYLIKRGIKPEYLEIYKNGKQLDQDAAVRDTQEFVNTKILGFNYDGFVNTCLMSTINYKPFFQLRAYERRLLVEQLLDLGCFAKMSKIAKAERVKLDLEIENLKHSIDLKKSEVTNNTNTIKTLQNILNIDTSKNSENVLKLKATLQVDKEKLLDLENSLKKNLEKDSEFNSQIKVLEDHLQKISNEMLIKGNDGKRLKAKRMDTNRNLCSDCGQTIMPDHIHNENSKIDKELSEIIKDVTKLSSDKKVIADQISVLKKSLDDNGTDNLKREIYSLKNQIVLSIKEIDKLEKSVNVDDNKVVLEIDKLNSNISAVSLEINKLELDYNELDKNRYINSEALELLKDTGIKSTIISNYIPILVNYINYYLEMMNFDLRVDLDADFKETFFNTQGENVGITYYNLSQGEKQRIDLGMSFAWRELAKTKGSINCNVLIIDEMLDASLDAIGTDDVLNILDGIDGNIFIVSHKNFLDDKVRSIIRMEKINGFSVLT